MTRAEWIEANRVSTIHNAFFRTQKWRAWSEARPNIYATGTTENEAIAALAGKLKWRLWV